MALAPWLMAQAALTQQSAEPQQPAMPPSQTQPAPSVPQTLNESGGLIESIGRLFDQGTAGFRSHLQGAQNSMGDLNQRAATTTRNIGDTAVEVGKNAVDASVAAAGVTKDAVGAVAKLPLSRVVVGRERCAVAPNGAPDCLAAAETLCRKQGYSSGKSMDFTSAEQCPPRVMLGGRQTEGDCTTVTFISRAMCQ